MKCLDVKNILLEKDLSEISQDILEKIGNHAEKCNECSVFLTKIKNAENYINELKKITPVLSDEDELTKGIIDKITLSNEQFVDKLFERVLNISYKPRLRWALTLVIILLFSLYLSQEYDAVEKITNLENKFNQISNEEFSTAMALPKTFESTTWMYKLYKFISSESDFVQVTDNLVIIKKEELKNLMKDYNSLNEDQRNKINLLKKELFPELNFLQTTEFKINRDEIKKRIDRL